MTPVTKPFHFQPLGVIPVMPFKSADEATVLTGFRLLEFSAPESISDSILGANFLRVALSPSIHSLAIFFSTLATRSLSDCVTFFRVLLAPLLHVDPPLFLIHNPSSNL
jgi:hypothetical protein